MQPALDPSRVVFLDETQATTNTSPIRALTHDGEKVTGLGEQEAGGHEMGRYILALQVKKSAELSDNDFAALRKVVAYVHRHVKQHPEEDVEKPAGANP